MIGQQSVRARRRVGRDWALPSGSSIRADDSWVSTTARRDGRGTEFFCRPIATPDLLTRAVSFSLCRAALRGGGNPNCGVVGIAFAAGAEEVGDDAGTTGTDASRLPTASAPHPYPSVTTRFLHAGKCEIDSTCTRPGIFTLHTSNLLFYHRSVYSSMTLQRAVHWFIFPAVLSLTPFARPSHIFGLDRTARTQGLEFGLVTQHLTEEAWTSCTGDPTGCLDRIDFVGTIQNPALRPTLCGTVGVVLQRPVPWAWSRSDSPIHMPSSVVKLNVQCNHAS
jgi:antimicrobial peptide system SdpA family protein